MIEIQLIGDQPMTCPKCGARTDWIDVVTPVYEQHHTCLNPACQHRFIAMEDEDREYGEDGEDDVD